MIAETQVLSGQTGTTSKENQIRYQICDPRNRRTTILQTIMTLYLDPQAQLLYEVESKNQNFQVQATAQLLKQLIVPLSSKNNIEQQAEFLADLLLQDDTITLQIHPYQLQLIQLAMSFAISNVDELSEALSIKESINADALSQHLNILHQLFEQLIDPRSSKH